MKFSCNGCRVLRKGCSDTCILKPSLEWINSPQSQATATLLLVKFYGRTALLNLLNNAPRHLAPAVFRSLLYEACGRLVNPISGSLGLFWNGEWAQCEAAVDAVLTGSRINVREKTRFKRVGEIIKPAARVGSIDLTAFERTVEGSLASQASTNRAKRTGLNLDLTLGICCPSTNANGTNSDG